MPTPVLATKLYIPPSRPKAVPRPRLIARLNEGLYRKLTLVSAPAGFGKSTLVSEWVNRKAEGRGIQDENDSLHPSSFIGVARNSHPSKVAWLSLDEGDNDPVRFLVYLVTALQTIKTNLGEGVLGALQSPQPPPPEAILTNLLNEIAIVPDKFILVLDDYHLIEAQPVNEALTFLVEHQPPQMHLVIATREDPQLPLPRLRARGQLTELRATDLRFTPSEAAEFLNQVMGLNLSPENIAALETRTEGWVAGLQLAALALQGSFSMQSQQDTTHFIQSFTGSHHFVLDYLLEEVLQRQPENIQTFLLHTSILERICGSLCDAILGTSPGFGQDTLTELEQANLFLIPLDSERRWYRYHHLFADLLRQRLQQRGEVNAAELHTRASQWFEANGLGIEAFHHAVAANDLENAARLAEGGEVPGAMPLLFLGAVGPVINWLESLPKPVLDARPSLWVMYASALLFVNRLTDVEPTVQAAEVALAKFEPDDRIRDLIGHLASIRATVAVVQNQLDTIMVQSRRALEYLHPNNLPVRTATTWSLGYAYQLQGNRAAASQAYTEAISISQAIGHFIINIMATLGLGKLQEGDTQLHLAVQTYQHALELIGEPPTVVASAAYLGLANIFYEWNDLEAAARYGEQSFSLARQYQNILDRVVMSEVFLARLKLAQGDVNGASAILAKAEQAVRQYHFVQQMPEVAAAQILVLLQQGKLDAAAQLAQAHNLPLSQARVCLAQGDPSAAMAVLAPWLQQVEANGWADEKLKAMVLQAVALSLKGENVEALQTLGDALALAKPGGLIRTFVDEGKPVMELLKKMKDEGGGMKDYIQKLIGAFRIQEDVHPRAFSPQPLIEPLSERELEVLQLIAQGLSNQEISERLFLALSTVKGHNRNIFGKLQVQRRTEAIARARELGLI